QRLDLRRRQTGRPSKKNTVLMLLVYRCDKGTPVHCWQRRWITAKETSSAFLGVLYQDLDPGLQRLVSRINLDIKVKIQTMTGADFQSLRQAPFAKGRCLGVRPRQHGVKAQFGGPGARLLP